MVNQKMKFATMEFVSDDLIIDKVVIDGQLGTKQVGVDLAPGLRALISSSVWCLLWVVSRPSTQPSLFPPSWKQAHLVKAGRACSFFQRQVMNFIQVVRRPLRHIPQSMPYRQPQPLLLAS